MYLLVNQLKEEIKNLKNEIISFSEFSYKNFLLENKIFKILIISGVVNMLIFSFMETEKIFNFTIFSCNRSNKEAKKEKRKEEDLTEDEKEEDLKKILKNVQKLTKEEKGIKNIFETKKKFFLNFCKFFFSIIVPFYSFFTMFNNFFLQIKCLISLTIMKIFPHKRKNGNLVEFPEKTKIIRILIRDIYFFFFILEIIISFIFLKKITASLYFVFKYSLIYSNIFIFIILFNKWTCNFFLNSLEKKQQKLLFIEDNGNIPNLT